MIPHEDRNGIGTWVEKFPICRWTNSIKNTAKKIEHMLRNVPEGAHVVSDVHEWGAFTRLFLTSHKQRQRGDKDIEESLRKKLKQLPNVNVGIWSFQGQSLPGMQSSSRGENISLIVRTNDSYEKLGATMCTL